jgi:hypothetical protein
MLATKGKRLALKNLLRRMRGRGVLRLLCRFKEEVLYGYQET